MIYEASVNDTQNILVFLIHEIRETDDYVTYYYMNKVEACVQRFM